MEVPERQGSNTPKLNTKIVEELLVRFLRDEITNAGFSKAVVGLSGGVDSAVSATLTAKALGKKNVLGVLLPYKTSNPQSTKDALLVAQKQGIVHDAFLLVGNFTQGRFPVHAEAFHKLVFSAET